ncbi:MAG: hypothetical protein ABL908_14095, partial [Hyphomicrobium sp.]
GYTLSASGIAFLSDQVVLAKQLSLSRSPDAHHACEKFRLGLLPEPERKEIVLAVAWITPANLIPQTRQVVQFRAKNSALAEEPIVPAE